MRRLRAGGTAGTAEPLAGIAAEISLAAFLRLGSCDFLPNEILFDISSKSYFDRALVGSKEQSSSSWVERGKSHIIGRLGSLSLGIGRNYPEMDLHKNTVIKITILHSSASLPLCTLSRTLMEFMVTKRSFYSPLCPALQWFLVPKSGTGSWKASE